jgi:hypothetical protein
MCVIRAWWSVEFHFEFEGATEEVADGYTAVATANKELGLSELGLGLCICNRSTALLIVTCTFCVSGPTSAHAFVCVRVPTLV